MLWHCWLGGRTGIRPVKNGWKGGGGQWLVRMEWCPAGLSVSLPLVIFPCTIKSRSSLLAPAHPGGPGRRAVKRLWWCWPLRCVLLIRPLADLACLAFSSPALCSTPAFSVAPYIAVCAETGGLFGLAVRMMQLFSDNKRYAGCLPTSLTFCSVQTVSLLISLSNIFLKIYFR